VYRILGPVLNKQTLKPAVITYYISCDL